MKLKLSLCVGICYLFVGAFSASIELKEDENYLPGKGFVCSVPSLPETRAANTFKLWPEGKVNYEISQKFDDIQKDQIKSAMKRIEAVSCVRFHEVENCEKGCIYIDDNARGGCNCYVGYDDTDKVRMNLQRPGCMSESTVIHELTHGLGRDHEQCRADRNVYVTIDETNIEEGKEHEYRRSENAKSFGLPYDYDSIMHYRGRGYAIDQSKNIIIVPKYWETSREADNSKMSLFDIKKLNTMYNCTRTSDE